jgi:hypothetical protein
MVIGVLENSRLPAGLGPETGSIASYVAAPRQVKG